VPISIKQILLNNENWWNFYQKHQNTIRPGIVRAVVSLLSCKHILRGYHTYCCTNENCPHIKWVIHTCKSKACSSCGKKSTERWIALQQQTLPKTTWQHITFTMPGALWKLFWLNRSMLNLLAKIGADIIKNIAGKKKAIPAIFIAIHTFGHDLKKNVHLHLSTTTGGLSEDHTHWVPLFFHHNTIMTQWRYQIISLFRKHLNQGKLRLPTEETPASFRKLLSLLYAQHWQVNCGKINKNYKHALHYLARYIKRPPFSESKLNHYDGQNVVFKYIDRKSQQIKQKQLSVEQFIAKFIQHIPDPGFRMIRYYGLLANRLRGKLLPIVYRLLNQQLETIRPPSFAELMLKNFSVDPLRCILCGASLVLSGISFGKTSATKLLPYHRQLALLQKCL
jgi:Putative transposase/Transposase zinc-binding domain